MYYKQVNKELFIALHAQGVTDQKLAEFFGISLSTVKRRREEYGLGSNCPRNNKGRLAEQLVAEYLQKQGMTVQKPAISGGPYDLLVDGFRVDVKAGQRRRTPAGAFPSYQFRIPEKRSSFYGTKSYVKDYDADTDLLALTVITEDQLAFLYMLPAYLWKPTITVHPGNPACEYQGYLDIRKAFKLVSPSKVA